jgi:membrane dipeptidase
MTDLPRLREGLVGAQFWSVYVTCGQEAYNGSRAVQATMEQIDVVYRLIEVRIFSLFITYYLLLINYS